MIKEVDADADDGCTTPDPFSQDLAIFDMTSLSLVDQYTASLLSYAQPSLLESFYPESTE